MKLLLLALMAGVFLFLTGNCGERVLPSRGSLLNPNASEPKQVMIDGQPPFGLSFEGKQYTLYPRASYELEGLIVSQHRSDSLLDQMHLRTGDFLNSRDFCIVWGKTLADGIYEKVDFHSGEWTCYWRPQNLEAAQAFNKNEIANNHVLAKNDAIRKALDAIEKGDEVRIKGTLVDYDINGVPIRKTSLVRDDIENGACETLYVESVSVVASHRKHWKTMRALGSWMILASLAGIVLIMARAVFGGATKNSNH